MAPLHTIILIAGPTAVGKSAMALSLAKAYDTAILSADARQCFREMSIGTAKPSVEELEVVPHYFINSHSISDKMSVGVYERYAMHALDEIFRKKSVAIVVGGTGMYINALIHGIDDMPATDEAIILEVNQVYGQGGIEALVAAISKEDPQYYQTGNIQNPARIMRALSFVRTHGSSILDFKKGEQKQRPFNVIGIGLEMDRTLLYDRINARVDKMMEDGLYEEVAGLFPYRDNVNLRTVGYQEFFTSEAMPTDRLDIESAVEKIKQHSRNYAKRQMTWFRNKCSLRWFAHNDTDAIVSYITHQLHNKQ